MVLIGIKNGKVDICVSVEDIQTLTEMYPEHIFIEQTGAETIGWSYDGVSFTAPIGA